MLILQFGKYIMVINVLICEIIIAKLVFFIFFAKILIFYYENKQIVAILIDVL